MELIITGSEGQLGMALQTVSEEFRQYKWVFLSKNEFNITRYEQMDSYLKESNRKNSIIINCAAYTDVEKAEQDHETSFLVNSAGAENLAKLSEKYRFKLIHISTDYVFNGEKSGSYNENDIPDPINVYGKSKLSGEKAIMRSRCQFIIIRASWLYSTSHQTFLNKILNKIKTCDVLKVVDDETGSPTYVIDLAYDLVIISEKISSEYKSYSDVYHYCNEGSVTRYEYAKKIIEFSDKNVNITAISSKELSMKAKRPVNSSLENSRIIKEFGLNIRSWEKALKEAVEKINAE